MLPIEEIEKIRFSTTLKGYSPREVDEFLERIKCEIAEICRENEELKRMLSAALATAAKTEPETEAEAEPVAEAKPESIPDDEAGQTIIIPSEPDDEYGEDEEPTQLSIENEIFIKNNIFIDDDSDDGMLGLHDGGLGILSPVFTAGNDNGGNNGNDAAADNGGLTVELVSEEDKAATATGEIGGELCDLLDPYEDAAEAKAAIEEPEQTEITEEPGTAGIENFFRPQFDVAEPEPPLDDKAEAAEPEPRNVEPDDEAEAQPREEKASPAEKPRTMMRVYRMKKKRASPTAKVEEDHAAEDADILAALRAEYGDIAEAEPAEDDLTEQSYDEYRYFFGFGKKKNKKDKKNKK